MYIYIYIYKTNWGPLFCTDCKYTVAYFFKTEIIVGVFYLSNIARNVLYKYLFLIPNKVNL